MHFATCLARQGRVTFAPDYSGQPESMEVDIMNVRTCKQTIIVSMAVAALAACAPAKQPPTSQMALAQAAVDKATAAGAYEYAPLELQASQNKVDAAKTAIAAKDYVKAEHLLEQAEVDAKLAEAKSGTAKTQKAVDELQKSIDILREEIQRKLPQ
jgi:hypothetical protein